MNLRKWAAGSAIAVFMIIVLVFAYQVSYPWVYPYYRGKYTDYKIETNMSFWGQGRVSLIFKILMDKTPYSELISSYSSIPLTQSEGQQEIYGEEGSRFYHNITTAQLDVAVNSHASFQMDYVVRAYSIRYELRGFDLRTVTNFIPDEAKPYTGGNSKIPVDDPLVKEIVAREVGGIRDPIEKAHRLYLWTARNIQYDLNQLGNINVDWIIQNRRAVCEGYAFVYATLCRAAGIPARVMVGAVAYNGESLWDLGHAWVEVYLHWGWVACDPTWGNGMLEQGKDIDAYWAGLQDDRAIPSMGRPMHITTGSIEELEGWTFGDLKKLQFDKWEQVSVVGDGFAGPPTETHTRQIWIATGFTFFLGTIGISFVIYRGIRRRRAKREERLELFEQPSVPSERLFCKHCGNRLSYGAIFCDQCGRRLIEVQRHPYALPGQLFCRYCGERLPTGAIFCVRCGRRLN